MNAERRRVAELRENPRVQIGIDLALQRIGARHGDAVAIGRRWRSVSEMVVFVGGDHKDRIILGDAVAGEAAEELAEGGVVRGQLLDVTGLARTERSFDTGRDTGEGEPTIIMRIGDV